MRIGVVGSMQVTERMIEAAEELKRRGHDAFVLSVFAEEYVGKTDEEKEVLKLDHKNNFDAMRVDCERIKDVDAVLALNVEKSGIPNYIGGNAFLELGYAHILNKKIYLLNPIPEIPFYKTELIAMQPVILDGDLSKV